MTMAYIEMKEMEFCIASMLFLGTISFVVVLGIVFGIRDFVKDVKKSKRNK